MKKSLIILVLVVVTFYSNKLSANEISEMSGDLVSWLSESRGSLIYEIKQNYNSDSQTFVPLARCDAEKNAFRSLIARLMNGIVDEETMRRLNVLNNKGKPNKKNSYNYEIIKFNDLETKVQYYVLMEPIGNPFVQNSGQGIFIINPKGDFRAIMSVPHVQFELNTAYISARMFTELNLRAMALSVAHRCANSTPTDCVGTTSVCGGYYRESDVGHNDCSFFQAFHEQINVRNNNDSVKKKSTVVQIHGASDSIDKVTGEYVYKNEYYFSDGAKHIITDPFEKKESKMLMMAKSMAERINEDIAFIDESKSKISSCQADRNEIDGIYSQNVLCGTANVQGRVLNGFESSDLACTSNVNTTSTNNRFIHIELRGDVRKEPLLEQRTNDLIDSLAEALL